MASKLTQAIQGAENVSASRGLGTVTPGGVRAVSFQAGRVVEPGQIVNSPHLFFNNRDTSGASDAELAQNIGKLGAALDQYGIAKEQYQNKTGAEDAQRMINSMSPDDIKKLNVIDAAQQQGFADSMSNPYFHAYAEKLRGQFLSGQMDREYTEKYQDVPAKSASDEQERYSEFSTKWKNDVMASSGAPANSEAFDTGFNEASLINSKSKADQWEKQDYQNKVATTMASTQSKFGSLIANSQELLQTPGAMTQAAQNILNEPRLMGLPVSQRVQMVDNWTKQLVQTGHIDENRLEQMLGSLTVSTNPDGSQVKASDVVNVQSLRTEAMNYRKQFMTKEKYQWMQGFIDKKDKIGAMEAVQNMSPEQAQEYAPMISHVISGVDQKVAAEQRAAAKAAAARLKVTQADVNIRGMLKAWVNGDTVSAGKMLPDLGKVPEDVKNSLFMESIGYAMDTSNQSDMSPQTRMQYINKIMEFPAFEKYRKALQGTYETDIRNIQLADDGSPVASGTAQMLIAMRQASPQNFAATFGDNLDSSVGTITTLIANHGGDLNSGLQDFAKYNSMDTDTRKDFAQQIKDQMNISGYTIAGMHSLGGGDTATISTMENSEMFDRVQEQALVYMAGGATPYEALNMAGRQVTEGYAYYHGAAVPKGVVNNVGTPDDEYYIQQALDRNVYNVASDAGIPATDVNVRYDNRNQTFYFSGGGQAATVSLGRLRDGAYDIYADDANNGRESGDTELSLDQANAGRGYTPAIFNDPVNTQGAT